MCGARSEYAEWPPLICAVTNRLRLKLLNIDPGFGGTLRSFREMYRFYPGAVKQAHKPKTNRSSEQTECHDLWFGNGLPCPFPRFMEIRLRCRLMSLMRQLTGLLVVLSGVVIIES